MARAVKHQSDASFRVVSLWADSEELSMQSRRRRKLGALEAVSPAGAVGAGFALAQWPAWQVDPGRRLRFPCALSKAFLSSRQR
jgi:hypothetical protein